LIDNESSDEGVPHIFEHSLMLRELRG